MWHYILVTTVLGAEVALHSVARETLAQSRMTTHYEWRVMDFLWQSPRHRATAVLLGDYNPVQALPFSVEAADRRLFLCFPRHLGGAPLTLATVPRDAEVKSPVLAPYPSWSWQFTSADIGSSSVKCGRRLVQVARVRADRCGRLWVVDGGVFKSTLRVCPPKLLVFDLATDQLLREYYIPPEQVNIIFSTFAAIDVDVSRGCSDAYAYWTDSLGFHIFSYSWRTNSSWRVSHPAFVFKPPPAPEAFFKVEKTPRVLPDGVYALVVPPRDAPPPLVGKDAVFWHSLTSFTENWVPAHVLQDPYASQNISEYRVVGNRGVELGQKVVGAIDSRGIMFYTLINQDAVACWNTSHEYSRLSQGVVSRGDPSFMYPGGLSLVPGARPGQDDDEVWVLSSAVLRTLQGGFVNINDINVRVYRASARYLSRGSVCESSVPDSFS